MMKTLREFIEQSDVILYHGTNKKHIDSFMENGLMPGKDEGRGVVFLTPNPKVAFGYASLGGEDEHLNGQSETVDPSERAIIKFKIPASWYKEYVVKERGGPTPEVSFRVGVPKEFIVDYKIGQTL